MKRILLLTLLAIQFGFSQSAYQVENLPSRVRMSGELLQMNNEDNIGFLGHGYEVFGLSKKYPNLYFGVNSYAAITGQRAGFIIFGITGGIQKYFYKDWLSYDTGLFLGGGGGGGAADGGGLMIRPHFDLQADLSDKIALRAGVTGVTFPSGDINSLHVNIGAIIRSNTYIANSIKANKGLSAANYHGITISGLSMNLLNYSKGPLKSNTTVNKSAPRISLIGALIKTEHKNSNFYGALKLGGAFDGGVDGFMMLLTGLGYELPLTNWLSIDAKGMIGGAGGGAVDFGGGLAAQIEAGLSLKLADYRISINGGNTYAPNGNFESNHLDIALGKRFSLYGNPKAKEIEVIKDNGVKKEDFMFSVFNRSYASGKKQDKKGRDYDPVFNLLGFELGKKINANIDVVAATVWAYQGSYGAYAEGWLGLQYNYALSTKSWLNVKGLVGAGGGGDIDLGSGLAYEYTLGFEHVLNKRWHFIANAGQIRGVSGNFSPYLLDVGVKLNMSQLVKK
ncbi:hypothetical protein [Wenyingzhuangia sp. IMCC45574]